MFQNSTPLDQIDQFANTLSAELKALRGRIFAPSEEKQFGRTFSTVDLEKLLGVPDNTLRALSLGGKGPTPTRLDNNRRVYTLAQVAELRKFLAQERPHDALKLDPRRRPHEPLQVIAASNFKGGSGKTATSLHLSHYLAIQGYRVLVIDLDPQASLTTTFGIQPEWDVSENGTAYAFLRYDEERKSIRSVIQKTYFDGIDLVPGQLEVHEFEYDTPAVLASGFRDDAGLFFERLRNALIDVKDDYDIVVLDTPPSLGYLTLTALYACTHIIVTTQAAMIDISSVNQYLLMLSSVGKELEAAGAYFQTDAIRFLFTRFNPNDASQKTIAGLMRSIFAQSVLTQEAVESSAVQQAGVAKKSIYEIESGEISRQVLLRAIEHIDAVNAEILGLIHKSWGRT